MPDLKSAGLTLGIGLAAGLGMTAGCSSGAGAGGTGAADAAGADGTAGMSSGTVVGASGSSSSGTQTASGSSSSGAAGGTGSSSAGASTSGGSSAGSVDGGSAEASSGTPGSADGGATADTDASEGGSGTGGGCPAGAIFCADFESGMIPAQAVYFPTAQRGKISTYMSVDSTVAHGGTHSLKITPGSNPSQMLAVTTGATAFWTRFYIRQDINTGTVMGHDTFTVGTDADGDENTGNRVRMGEHHCRLELSNKIANQNDDGEILSSVAGATSANTCMGGVGFAPNTWYCVEEFYDGPHSTVRVLVDGTETGLQETTWGPYKYDVFDFGFETYDGVTRTLWYDDVAIATSRIGCQ